MTEIEFDVDGLPPAKSETLSMLGANHGHAPRVRALLLSAQQAMISQNFAVLTGPIGLAVMVWVPASGAKSDATNFLGGIADVLEAKAVRSRTQSLEHLGDLASVGIYVNDSQIREVHYREETSTTARYRVRVWELSF